MYVIKYGNEKRIDRIKCYVYLSAFSGGEVGLAITQVMAMTGIIQWGMRQSAEVANQMMAVERVLEYIQLPAEPNLRHRGIYVKKKDKNLALPSNSPKNWPDQGCIKFKNIYMRYADEDPPVLKGLNIVIHPGEKVREFYEINFIETDE